MRVQSLVVIAAVALFGSPALAAAQKTSGQSSRQPTQPWPLERIQGFHVVLVVGGTQSLDTQGSPELPPSAQRAINDMREFLPYKHYRVLDAQWSSCCSGPQSRISGRLQGVIGVPGSNGATNLVHRPYAFTIIARSAASGIQTRFVLAAQDHRASTESSVERAELERLIENAMEDLATLELRVDEIRRGFEAGIRSELEVREATDKVTQARRNIEGLRAQIERLATGGESGVMDSSFTMDAGETVVVGTSRLGGDRALIAIVTAVSKGTK